jgi:hypothetical protein
VVLLGAVLVGLRGRADVLLVHAGHHVADRTCSPAVDGFTGDPSGKKWGRALRVAKGIKFKQAWVQHRDDRVSKGQVAIYFFPTGTATKAVVELTDGGEVYSVLVHGLTGRVELLGLDRAALVAQCRDWGEKPFRAQQLMRWVHRRLESDVDAMSDLARSFRQALSVRARVSAPGSQAF